jgi:hypothetical protein
MSDQYITPAMAKQKTANPTVSILFDLRNSMAEFNTQV